MEEFHLEVPGTTPRRSALALPEGATGSVPGVVIVHDIVGFSADVRRHVLRFAEAGYAALAPDLFGRRTPGCIVRAIKAARAGEGEAFEVLRAARAHLAAQEAVDGARLGIVGFCLGGGFALIAAADEPYRVAGPFYGEVPEDPERLRGLCPTLAQYGSRDRMYRSHATRLRQHLEVLDVPGEVVMHEGVGHSFMNRLPPWLSLGGVLPPMHAAYDEATEADAWERLLGFFATHL
ncbi:MAG: dienelactone hydrolase family protein [Myxococcota bacterium]